MLASVWVGAIMMAQEGVAFGTERFQGGHGDPNEFAKMLLVAVAITVTTDVFVTQRKRGLIAMILLASVFMTYSRMGVLIAVCVLVVVGAKRLVDAADKHGYAYSVIMGIALFCGIALVIVAVPWREWPVSAPFVNRFVSSPATLLTAPEKLDVLTNGRWRIYGASVEAFVNAPLKSQLLGVGYNGSRESLAGSLGRLVSTHSVYLQVLLDFGILGTLLFLCLLVFLLDWTRMGVLNWFWRNAVIVTYLLTFGALAWLLSWSDIVLFACVGTPSFKYLYSRHVVERG